jgi:hypothetical protein
MGRAGEKMSQIIDNDKMFLYLVAVGILSVVATSAAKYSEVKGKQLM